MDGVDIAVAVVVVVLCAFLVVCGIGMVGALTDSQANWTWRCEQTVTPQRTVSWDCRWVQ